MMRVIGIAFAELVGLFVDDGALALLVLALVSSLGALVGLGVVSGTTGGVALGAGCLAILAESLARVARRRTGGPER